MCRATLCTTIFVLIFSKVSLLSKLFRIVSLRVFQYVIQVQCSVFEMMKDLVVKAKDRIHAAIKDSVSDVFAAIKDYAYKVNINKIFILTFTVKFSVFHSTSIHPGQG